MGMARLVRVNVDNGYDRPCAQRLIAVSLHDFTLNLISSSSASCVRVCVCVCVCVVYRNINTWWANKVNMTSSVNREVDHLIVCVLMSKYALFA